MANRTKMSKARRYWMRNKWELLFYSFMMLWPVLQFSVFYIGVNFRSVLLAFQDINYTEHTVTWTFDIMKTAFWKMTHEAIMHYAFRRSLIVYFIGLFIGIPLGLFFSFYIYKKSFLSNFFRVMLFLPSILSGIVTVTIFKYFVNSAIPVLFKEVLHIGFEGLEDGLLGMPDTRTFCVMFFYVFVSFGTSVLVYANAMSGISDEVIESVHLDGAYGIREFLFITFPLIFPTVSTFLITGVAGIFSNQVNLFSFYGRHAPDDLWTYGYYIFVKTEEVITTSDFSELAAMGILMTCVAVPLTLVIKWGLEKFGPSED